MTEETPPQDLIRYDVLTQDALRSVIKNVLDEVVAAGLPGDHHFFISFNTNHPKVRLSDRMRKQYPKAMTIVIQHSFWNLETSDTDFQIDLSFNDIREKLRIPFEAIISFFDPSVKFGLQFDEAEQMGVNENKEHMLNLVEDEPDEIEAVKKTPATKPQKATKKASKKPKKSEVSEEAAEATDDLGAEVVSLDAFRKK